MTSNSWFEQLKSLQPSLAYVQATSFLQDQAIKHHLDMVSMLQLLDQQLIWRGFRSWYSAQGLKYYKHPQPLITDCDRAEAEWLVLFMPLLVTGARPGEIIEGTKTQSKGAVMKLHGSIVPPRTKYLNAVRKEPDLWLRLINKLSAISFFAALSPLERMFWLQNHQSEQDLHLENVSGLEVEVMQYSSDFLVLAEADLTLLGQGKVSMTKLYQMFPLKPGSPGLQGRHTLIFRRGIWRVTDVYQTAQSFPGEVLNTVSGVLEVTSQAQPSEKILIFSQLAANYIRKNKKFVPDGHKSLGFLVSTPGLQLRKELVFPLVLTDSHYSVSDLELVERQTRGFTPAGYKSLLQKIIRFQAHKVDLGSGIIVDSDLALRATYALLILHPGSFVPDIQRFVSGLESGLKRMLVSLFEDGYFPSDSESRALAVTVGAFLAQRAPGWKPSAELLLWGLRLGLNSLQDNRAWLYNFQRGSTVSPPLLEVGTTHLGLICSLIQELKSFLWDHWMIRDIAETSRLETVQLWESNIRPEVMPLEQCMDFHWAPEVAYFFPPSVVYSEAVAGNQPYSQLFSRIFQEVTGINPRRNGQPDGTRVGLRSYDEQFEQREFVQTCRQAQNQALECRRLTSEQMIQHTVTGEQFELKYELDKGWLAGLLGALEIPGRPRALVTLHPDDPRILIAVQKPHRGMKDPILSDEREAEALAQARSLLQRGVRLKATRPPIESLRGAVLILRDGDYYLQLKSNLNSSSNSKSKSELVTWAEVSKGRISVPYIQDVELTLANAIQYRGYGAVQQGEEKLHSLLSRYSILEIRRLLVYISSYCAEFEVNRLGREGGGTKQAVTIHDVAAYQLLLKISLLYPSAIQRVSGRALKFRSPIGPLLWKVKDLINQYLNDFVSSNSVSDSISNQEADDRTNWGQLGDTRGRTLWDHQVTALRDMKRAQCRGRKGHFIWISVGLGKTLLVLNYLQYMLQIGQLPKYIIYTLPASAIESVRSEILAFGFDCQLLVPLKSLGKKYKSLSYATKGAVPKEYCINLIEHDHLRRCEVELSSYVPDSIFIIDEVHKCLNQSKRTAVALQFSSLAQEFIALTGTPVIDSNTYKLIWWLKQIVEFEVNEKNFWVAANGMVAKKATTGIQVERQNFLAGFTTEEQSSYNQLVPSSLGGNNSQAGPRDLQRAMELCYEATDRQLIELVQQHLVNGVFLVTKDTKHQQKLYTMILNQTELGEDDVFLIQSGQSLFLTDETVQHRKTKDYKVVITTIRRSEGYTLTRLGVMLSSVYPSNQATREQLEGRINRIGQSRSAVSYFIVHIGILSHILERYNDARNLAAVLSSLADEVTDFQIMG